MDFWRRLPAIVRIPVAFTILALSTLLFVSDRRAARGAALIFALGVILLFTGPTDAQKKGYHDF